MFQVPPNPFHTFLLGCTGGKAESSIQSGQSFQVPRETVTAHKLTELLKIKLPFSYISTIGQTFHHPIKTIRSNQLDSQMCKSNYFSSSFLLFFFFFFLQLHLQHMELPRLGVKLELQLLAYATPTATPDPSCICNLHHSLQQCQSHNPLSQEKDQTCILVDTMSGS